MHAKLRNAVQLFVLCGWVDASAQCTGTLALGPDITICPGSSVLLNAGPGFQSYAWSTGGTGQSITVTAAGTYSCTVTDFNTSGELVTNGDFSNGSAGFTSDYVPGTGGSFGLLSDPGRYAVSTDPQLTHTNFASFGDHTPGTGGMLVVNGASIPGQSVWCQTVAVLPNSNYVFSAWLASCVSGSPAQLVFTINGITIGAPLQAPPTTGQWVNFSSIWNSGTSTSATICIVNQNTNGSGNDFALDDISFAPFCTYTDEVIVTIQDFPQPDLGADIRICAGTNVTLDATTAGADGYAWQDGSTGTAFAPTSTGIYWVDVTENGCTARDSVEVIFDVQPTVELGADQALCEGDVVTLNATFPGASYLWQDGTTAATFSATGSGSYSVVLDIAGCTATDQVDLTFYPFPVIDLGPDTTICADTSLTVDVARPGGSYLWEDGSTAAQRTLTEPGTYHVTVTVNDCSTIDSLVLGRTPLPFVDLGADFLLCTGTRATLDGASVGSTYLWNTGETTSTIVIDSEGLYHVLVTSPCGQVTDSITVTQDLCDCPVFVANAFTPDGNGVNDRFRPLFDCPVDQYLFTVFDRWGREVWQSEDPLEGWDGGGKAPDGTATGIYAWRLELRPRTVNESTPRELYGHVVLLR